MRFTAAILLPLRWTAALLPVRRAAALLPVRWAAVVLLLAPAACGSRMDDVVETSANSIRSFLRDQRVYDPDNLPDPVPADIAGYYRIIDGAFRWIYNENEDGRENQPEVEAGDLVGLWFDARIFKGKFDTAETFFTNIQEQINAIAGSNAEFDASLWSTVPLEFTVGAGEGIIIPAVENCLSGVRRGDVVRIFLTPDLWNGNRGMANVPAWSTLAFQITVDSVVKR